MSVRLRSRASSSPASAQSSHGRPPAGQQQKPCRGRIFSGEDEIQLLKSLSQLTNPFLSTDLERIEKSLGSKFTRHQISSKIQRLRGKYKRQADITVPLKTRHDRKVFELARDVWGKELSSGKARKDKEEKQQENLEKEREKDEGEILGGEARKDKEEKQQVNLEKEREKDEDEILGGEENGGGVVAVVDPGSFPELVNECGKSFPGNGLWWKGLKRCREGALRQMNERIVRIKQEEEDLMAKKLKLTEDLARMILDSVASSAKASAT